MTANPEPFNISDGLVVRRRLRSTAQSLECTTMHSAVARVSSAAQDPWWMWACPGNRMLLVGKCSWWERPRHRLIMYGRRDFSVAGPTAWNSRPHRVRNPSTTESVL